METSMFGKNKSTGIEGMMYDRIRQMTTDEINCAIDFYDGCDPNSQVKFFNLWVSGRDLVSALDWERNSR